MVPEVVGVVLVAFAVMIAAALLRLPGPGPGPGREAPPDRPVPGLVVATTRPAGSAAPVPSAPDPAPPPGDRHDPPTEVRMWPLDVWDVLTWFLILAMTLAAPVVGRAAAVLVIPVMLVGLPLAVAALTGHVRPPGRRRSE